MKIAARRALQAFPLACALLWMRASSALALTCPSDQKFCPGAGGCIGARDLCLLEPTPGGVTFIPASATNDLGAFLLYVNQGIWVWAFGVAIGIAVLNGTIAGFQIMMGDRDKGKERFIWATIGLLILLLSGTLLAFINPQGFQSA